jgi:putative hemolysin
VQVGITLVAILSGAFGEAALAEHLQVWLSDFPPLAPHAKELALALVAIFITYLSVVIRELVPKQLALLAPEAVASGVARPFRVLSRMALPLVWVLSVSSSLILGLLGARRQEAPPVTDEEIKVRIAQRAETWGIPRERAGDSRLAATRSDAGRREQANCQAGNGANPGQALPAASFRQSPHR